MSLPTLDDFKVHLNKTDAKDDAELSDMLYAAVDAVEGLVGPLRTREVTETHRRASGSCLLLKQRPAGSLVSVSSRMYPGWDLVAQSVDGYELDSDAGLVWAGTAGWFSGDVVVTYTTGREYVPDAVRLAILIVGAHLWETQRGTSPSALALQGADADFPVNNGAGYAIPNRATELLAPYLRNSQIA